MADTEPKPKKKKERKLVDPNETPRQRWKRLIGPRARRLVDTAGLLENLRGAVYDWDPETEKELFSEFEKALSKLKSAWELNETADSDEVVEEVSEDAPVVSEEPKEGRKPATVSSGEKSDIEW